MQFRKAMEYSDISAADDAWRDGAQIDGYDPIFRWRGEMCRGRQVPSSCIENSFIYRLHARFAS